MGKTERINLIDYLKAIAILLVIFDHIGIAPTNSIVYCFGIRMAVPVFMTLSGYTFAMSYSKKSFREMYKWNFLRTKLFRYGFPAAITCIIIWVVDDKKQNILRMLFMGEYGPGAYYPVMMLQLVLFFPILFYLIRAGYKVTLIVIAVINVLWEVSVWMLQVDNTMYRLVIFRYIIYIALGIFLYEGIKFSTGCLVGAFVCGIIYIYAIGRLGYQPYIFRNWSNTAFPVALYIFPIMYVLFNKLKNCKICGIIGEWLGIIGNASYHILFAQMFTRIIWIHFGSVEFLSVILIRVVGSVVLGVVMWKCETVGKLKR